MRPSGSLPGRIRQARSSERHPPPAVARRVRDSPSRRLASFRPAISRFPHIRIARSLRPCRHRAAAEPHRVGSKVPGAGRYQILYPSRPRPQRTVMRFEEPPAVRQRRFDESGMEILAESTCVRILHDQSLGRVGFIDDDGEPLVLPVSYRFHRRRVYFYSSEGAKLRAATRGTWCASSRRLEPGDRRRLERAGEGRLSSGRGGGGLRPDLRPWLRTALRPMKLVEIVPEEISGRNFRAARWRRSGIDRRTV